MDNTKNAKLVESSDTVDFVLSDLIPEISKNSEPWNDFTGYDVPLGTEELLYEREIAEKDLPRLLEMGDMAGLSSACKEYFRENPTNPTYEGFKEFSGLSIARCYFDPYLQKFKAYPNWANGGSSGNFVPAQPEKIFDPSLASPDLLKLVKLFDSSDEKTVSIAAAVNEKFERIYDLAYAIAAKQSNSRHGMVCGDAGVGKSFEVNKAINHGISKSGLTLVATRGDAAGRSLSSLVQFMWDNREGKLILMDDSDGILTVKDAGIDNALKSFFDTDNPVFTMSSSLNDYLNRAATRRAPRRESVHIDASRLHENVVSFRDADGVVLATESIDPSQKRFFESLQDRINSRKSSKKAILEKYARTGVFSRIREDDEDDDWGEGDEEGDEEFVDTNENSIPIAFEFKSRTIFISNLKREQLTDAVKTRFDIEEVSLTNEEFIARLKSIIGTMNVNREGAFTKELSEHGKKVILALVCVLVEGYETGAKLGGQSVVLGGKLQFRLIPQLVDKWCRLATKYMAQSKVTDLRKVEAAIHQRFIRMYALPAFANLRDSKTR